MKQEGKGIKTREIKHGVKALDKAAVAAEKMRRAAARTKEQCKNLMDDGQITPEEYAGDMVRDVADNAVAGIERKAKELFRTTRKAKERFRHQREKNQIDNQKYRGRQAEITGADRKDDGMGDRSSGGMYGNNSQAPAGRRLTEAEKIRTTLRRENMASGSMRRGFTLPIKRRSTKQNSLLDVVSKRLPDQSEWSEQKTEP